MGVRDLSSRMSAATHLFILSSLATGPRRNLAATTIMLVARSRCAPFFAARFQICPQRCAGSLILCAAHLQRPADFFHGTFIHTCCAAPGHCQRTARKLESCTNDIGGLLWCTILQAAAHECDIQ